MSEKTLKNNAKKSNEKKKLIRTKKEVATIKIISVIVILAILIVSYYLIDSRSYVAKVASDRISKPEFMFFLSQQVAYTEYEEGLTNAVDKRKFWTTPADGKDPWEEAKIKALDLAKEYSIQLIKAKEAGFKTDSAIKNQVYSLMASMQGQMSNKQFNQYIRGTYNVSPAQLQKIWENYSVIEKFKDDYLEKNYKQEELSEQEIKARYDEDPKKFDTVDVSYISLYKYDEDFNTLSEDEINEKMKTAEEVLRLIEEGQNMDELIAKYSEDVEEDDSDNTGEKSEEETTAPGKSTLQYSEGNELSEWAFDHQPGEAGIVDTEYVIYVLKVDDRTEYTEVRDKVKTTMENEAKEKFYEEVLNEWSLEPRYNIIKNDKVYDSITYK